MQLLSTHFTAALSAAGNHAATATAANRASKRTTWYPAFSEKAAWSSIG
ncbi:MAG: hypothetical protein Q8L08_08295 [Candidatus Nanopelagicaceae bacterium]|nr:hypothetical protein [Candidatus Nanopelagicaceae bacterium]